MPWTIRESFRRRRGRETLLIPRKHSGACSVCLIFPNRYHLGMSNLGFQTVHSLLNGIDDVVCERAFLPDPDEAHVYRTSSSPLRSLESERPVADFDIVAFSVPFEADYPAIAALLSRASIPPLARDRDERSPLIMGGGAALFLNPEPVADLFDLIYLGEAESSLAAVIDAIRREHSDRRRLLRRVAGMTGVYVPSLYRIEYEGERIVRREAMDGAPELIERAVSRSLRSPAASSILTPDTEFSSMPLVEVSRGCPRGCRFCAAGFMYHPYRVSPAASILERLDRIGIEGKRVGLVGAAVSDHPEIELICSTIVSRGGSVSLSSLRLDALTPTLLELLRRSGCRSAAIAPEGGSQRLRNLIRKGIDEEQIVQATELLVDHDILNIKLYVILGLPTETDDDVDELIHLVSRVRKVLLERSRPKGRIGGLLLSVNPFIPKPFTPFQWCGMEPIPTLERKVTHLRKSLRTIPNVELQVEPLRDAWLQALFSRGDRRLGEVIVRAASLGLRGELKRAGYPAERVVTRNIPLTEILPWGFIGPDRSSHLMNEYRLAFAPES